MTEVADAESRRKPRRVWPWVVLAFVVGLFTLVLIGALSIRAVGGRRWKEAKARQALLMSRLTAATGERQPLVGGPGDEGNAWDEYLALFAAILPLSKAEGDARFDMMYASRAGTLTPEQVEKRDAGTKVMERTLERIRPELVRLRAAGRLRVAKMNVPWQKGMSMDLPHLGQARTICRLIGSSIRLRIASGNIDGALDDFETVLQLAVDIANSPFVVSMFVGSACIHDALTDLSALLAVATTEQRARMASLAVAADAQFPTLASAMDTERALVHESLKMCIEAGASLDELGGRGGIATAWRHGFSLKIIASECDSAYLQAADETRTAEGLPWKQASALLLASEDRAVKSENPILRFVFVSTFSAEKNMRITRAKLLLLQAAVLYLDGTGASDPAWPSDPFSRSPLRIRVDPGKTVFWSPGAGGPDTGTGRWDGPEDKEDLVLEVYTK